MKLLAILMVFLFLCMVVLAAVALRLLARPGFGRRGQGGGGDEDGSKAG
jgi:hypothetical protein